MNINIRGDGVKHFGSKGKYYGFGAVAKYTKTETLKKVKMEKRKETMTKLSSDGSINQP